MPLTKTGVIRGSDHLSNPQIPPPPGSRAFYGLRATPPIFTAIVAGSTNADFTFRAIPQATPPERFLESRIIRPKFTVPGGVPPAAITYDLAMTFANIGRVTAKTTVALPLTMTFSLGGAIIAPTTGGLYASLIAADRPTAWWGFDTSPTTDESGHGYDLTATGSPATGGTLLSHGNEVNGASRDFNGTTDAYWTLGTLYEPPTAPPRFHAATAGANNTTTTDVVSPGGIEAGDLVLACLAHEIETATISAAPSGWTQVGTTLNASTCAVAIYKRLPVVDEPPAGYSWTWDTAGTTLGTILVYRGADQAVSGLVFDSGQQLTSVGYFHSTTTETNPIQSHALAFWAAEMTGTITPDPTDVNTRVAISTDDVNITVAEYDIESAGSVTKTASTNVSTALGAFLLTFGSPNEVLEDGLDTLNQNVSLHALIRPDTVAAGTRTIIRKHQSWGLHLNGATLEFVYRDGGGVDRTITGPTVSASTVTHVVVTDDGTNINFYKNNVKTSVARTGSAGYTTNTQRVTVGAYHNGTSFTNFFDGRLDEVAVFSAAVSDQMVATWFQAHTFGTFGTRLLGSTNFPALKLEMAFKSSPTDDTLVWEDVTVDLRAADTLSPKRGRNFELDRIEAGSMTFTLSNRNRQYDDTYASSPYYPNVKPTRPVRLRAQVSTDSVAYPIFFGYTEGHPLMRLAYGKDSVASFTATDAFKALALDKVQGTFVRPQETTGARLEALLDGFPGVPFEGETGQSEIVGDDLIGVNSLDHAQTVAETEGGVFFADASGTIIFQDRHHRMKDEQTLQATYGDGGGAELPVKHMEPLTDEARLFTASAITPASGVTTRDIDATQSLSHFVRTKEITTLHAIDNDAQAMAEAYAHRYATPRTRIPAVQVQPAAYSSPAVMWAIVLAHEISNRIRTVERPIGDTSAVTRDHFIEGISHSITGDDWIVTLSVSPAELDAQTWKLGTGELGDTTGATNTRLGW